MTIIQQVEATPAAYNAKPAKESNGDAVDLFGDIAWQRIEAWIAWRFSPRNVTWIVEGCGEFVPPLTPVSMTTTEWWNGSAWETATLDPSPLGGYVLPGEGPYRFSGTVGTAADQAPPEIVQDAVRRLAEYLAAKPDDDPGVTTMRDDIPGVRTIERQRAASWAARAIHNSGAGDLLRAYRRA